MPCRRCDFEGEGNFCSNCGASLATGKKPGTSGCTIAAIAMGVMFVVAIPVVGIISAIAIPNLLNAIQRGKQKRTMGDLRILATGVESYSIDYNSYPGTDGWTNTEELTESLSPTYVKAPPLIDGWMQPFRYASDGRSYRLESSGKDGVWEDPPPEGGTQNFNSDILFSDGRFTAWPEGTQD